MSALARRPSAGGSLQPAAAALTPALVAAQLPNPAIVPVTDAAFHWSETGRLRLGDSTPAGRSGRGKQARKLYQYRVTSRRREPVERVAELYGGEVTRWQDAPGGPQWQAYTTAEWLDVMLPPVAAGSQWYEHWDLPDQPKAPPVCLRRCTGTFEQRTGGPCICAAEGATRDDDDDGDPEGDGEAIAPGPALPPARLCKRMTRLSLLLSDALDLGVWRLQSSGREAGDQLVTFLLFWAPRLPPYARLQLGVDKAIRPRRKPDGDWQLVSFPVPILRADPEAGRSAGDLLQAGPGGPGGGPEATPPPGVGPEGDPDLGEAGPADPEGDPEGDPVPPPDPEGDPELVGELADRVQQQAAKTARGGGDPPPATPAPGRLEDHPVLAWCRSHNLAPGTARLFLATVHRDQFGKDGSWPLVTLNDVGRLPEQPTRFAVDALARHFTATGEPNDWDNGAPDSGQPPPEVPGQAAFPIGADR